MRLEDDAEFQCQVGAAENVAPIRSEYAKLIVLVPPDPPQIRSAMPGDGPFKKVEGEKIELKCESRGGKPASEVSINKQEKKTLLQCTRLMTLQL